MRNIKTRDGYEFWDKLNALPRYAFLLSPSGKSVQKFEDQSMGNWVDVHEAQQIIDQAEERISERQDELGEVSRQLEKFRSRSHGIKNLSAIEARDDQIGAASLKINALQQRLAAADEREDALGSLVPEAELALKALNVAVSVYDVELADSARRGLRLIIAALKAAEQPAPVTVGLPVDPERERLMEIVQQYPNIDPLEYDAAVRALSK